MGELGKNTSINPTPKKPKHWLGEQPSFKKSVIKKYTNYRT